MDKLINLELTEEEAKQVWYLLNLSDNSIKAAIEVGLERKQFKERLNEYLMCKRTKGLWIKLGNLLTAEEIDPFE
jgi:hypothetical protein